MARHLTINISGTDFDLFASVTTLGQQIKVVKDGDLRCAVMTGAAKANTLDLIFNSLVMYASECANTESVAQKATDEIKTNFTKKLFNKETCE